MLNYKLSMYSIYEKLKIYQPILLFPHCNFFPHKKCVGSPCRKTYPVKQGEHYLGNFGNLEKRVHFLKIFAGISGKNVIPVIITCTLQGMFCDTGIPHTFYGGKICSVLLQSTKKMILTSLQILVSTTFELYCWFTTNVQEKT